MKITYSKENINSFGRINFSDSIIGNASVCKTTRSRATNMLTVISRALPTLAISLFKLKNAMAFRKRCSTLANLGLTLHLKNSKHHEHQFSNSYSSNSLLN